MVGISSIGGKGMQPANLEWYLANKGVITDSELEEDPVMSNLTKTVFHKVGVECGVWSGVWSVVWSVECGVVCGVWRGVWSVAWCVMWSVVWGVECGVIIE
jgi:hypothetical protein